MKTLKNKIGSINLVGLVIVSTIILPLTVSITIKVLNTQNIIF
jgi:hypothetical protein